MKKKLFIIMFLCCLVICSCSDFSKENTVFNILTGHDNSVPVLLETSSVSPDTVLLTFNEKIRAYGDSFRPFDVSQNDDYSITVHLNSSLPPGKKTEISGRVEDVYGNSTGLKVSVWGFNPNLASAKINEFTVKGNETNPDRTELFITKKGNLNGMTLYGGIPSNYDCLATLPDINVSAGDFIVIWWTEKLPSGVKEHPENGVWNICAKSEKDLTSNNGVLTLMSTPGQGALILDAVLYSAGGSSQYDGWGTKNAKERADFVLNLGSWINTAVNPSSSTATRSLSRKLTALDTDTADDWYVTVTGGATFGSTNISKPY